MEHFSPCHQRQFGSPERKGHSAIEKRQKKPQTPGNEFPKISGSAAELKFYESKMLNSVTWV